MHNNRKADVCNRLAVSIEMIMMCDRGKEKVYCFVNSDSRDVLCVFICLADLYVSMEQHIRIFEYCPLNGLN